MTGPRPCWRYWRLTIETRETNGFVVVRALTEAGQVFAELVKPAAEREAAIAKMRDYCAASKTTAEAGWP